MKRLVLPLVFVLIVGCQASRTSAPPVPLTAEELRIRAAIRDLLGYYASWEGPYAAEQVEQRKGAFESVPKDDPKWLAFKTQILPNDTVYFVDTGEESWTRLMGRAGYIIIREGKGVAFYCTMMN